MSNKGYPSQDKQTRTIPPYSPDECRSESQFQTFQESFSRKISADGMINGVYRISGSALVTEAGSEDFKRVIKCTGHGGAKGDMVRFEVTAANPGFESQIISVPDADTIILAGNLHADYVVGDEFFILRTITMQLGSDGTITVSTGPVQFIKDAVTTTVEEDTGTPSNSNPLPVKLLATTGASAVYGTGFADDETLRVVESSELLADSVRIDYNSTNNVSGAWTQIIATTANDGRHITLFDSGGYSFELGVGAIGLESRVILGPPGGLNGPIPVAIPAGSRVSMRAIGTATVNVGELILNILG